MRKLILALTLAAPLGMANLHPIPWITGSGAAVQICASIPTACAARAAWIQVITPSTNAATVQFGDSTVSTTAGLPIAAGAGYNTPTCPNCIYTLGSHWVYVANGDKVYLAWGDGQ